MSARALTPFQPGDLRYVFGVCTWHGPIAEAGKRPGSGQPCCPQCGGDLFEKPSEDDWLADIASADKLLPGYADMLRWSRGQCFPDYDTLVNAWRQHMEGES